MLAFHMLVTGTNIDILELLQVLLAMEELLVVTGSVGNPNTLNFDSDPDFGPIWIRILVQIRIQDYVINYERKI